MRWGSRNRRTPEFRALFAGLGGAGQAAARASFRVFRRDPDSPSLRVHVLQSSHRGRHLPGSISVSISISMKYRAICRVEGDLNLWCWIGSHNAHETYIGRK